MERLFSLQLKADTRFKGYKLTGTGGFIDPYHHLGWLGVRLSQSGSGLWLWKIAGYDLSTQEELYLLESHAYPEWIYFEAQNKRLLIGHVAKTQIFAPSENNIESHENSIPALKTYALWKGKSLLGPFNQVKESRDEGDNLILFDPVNLSIQKTWVLNTPINQLVTSECGQLAMSSLQAGTWKIGWGKDPEDLNWVLAPGKPILTLQWIPQTSLLAVGRQNGLLEIWDFESGQIEYQYKLASAVRKLCISHTGQHLFVASNDFCIHQFNLKNLNLNFSWKAHKNYITGLGLSKDQKILFSAASDLTLQAWRLDSSSKNG